MEKVAGWVSGALENQKFPFCIDSKKAGFIYQRFKIEQKPVAKLPEDADTKKPAYVAMIPHAISSLDLLRRQTALLQEEGFGVNQEESKEEAKARLRVVFGANWAYSLDAQVNKVMKEYLCSLEPLSTSNVHFEAFSWTPVWIQEGCKERIDVKIVKRLFRLISEMNRDISVIMLNRLMASKVIPMQSIREEIKNSKFLASHVISLRRGVKNRLIFLACMDDDAISLRTDGKGVFSHYDALLASNQRLQTATTGYIMKNSVQDFFEVGSKADLVFRRALGFAAYFPEPNFITRISFPFKEAITKISFMRKGKGKGKGLEFLGLMENLRPTLKDLKDNWVFGEQGPIVTAGTRVKVPKHMPARITSANLRKAKNLASLRKFLQSSVHPTTGFASCVGRMFP